MNNNKKAITELRQRYIKKDAENITTINEHQIIVVQNLANGQTFEIDSVEVDAETTRIIIHVK